MRNRNIQKIIRLNRKEAQELSRKARRTCMSEAGLVRMLIKGYEPKEQPDEKFYEVMKELSVIGNNLTQLVKKAQSVGCIDVMMIKQESDKWNKFQSEIERRYLRPDKVREKWQ